MAEDGNEDTALARLIGPEQRTRLRLFLLRGEDGDLAQVTGQIPVTLVNELALRDAIDNRVLCVGGERQIELAMSEFRARLPGEPDAGSKLLGGALAVDGEVQQHEAAAAGKEGVEFLGSLWRPALIGGEDDDRVGRFKLFRSGPQLGRRNADAWRLAEELLPALLPQRIIVLAWTVVFRSTDKDDFKRLQIASIERRRILNEGRDFFSRARGR